MKKNKKHYVIAGIEYTSIEITASNPETGAKIKINALMSEQRIMKIPAGWNRYSLREDDTLSGTPVTIEKTVYVNHYADILTDKPLEFNDYLEITDYNIN